MLRRLLHCRKASQLRRRLSSDSKEIFDRALKERQRAFTLQGSSFEQYDYLRVECAERLVDRLDDISRTFPSVLELGAHRGHIAQIMRSRNGPDADTLVGGVERLVQCDMAGCFTHSSTPLRANGIETSFLRADEENLKFEDNSFDLVLSSLALHWVNDLPSSLKRIREILRPDGAFIGCMLGGSTLQELRHCFFLAEQERKGGVSPHCSPLVRPSDVASLLQGAGFSLPTVDVDTLTVLAMIIIVSISHLHVYHWSRYPTLMRLLLWSICRAWESRWPLTAEGTPLEEILWLLWLRYIKVKARLVRNLMQWIDLLLLFSMCQ